MFLVKGFCLNVLLVVLFSGIFLGSQALARTEDISIVEFSFTPQFDTISVNDSVRWTNNGIVNHTTTSDTRIWSSGLLAPGESYLREFTTPGSFPYACSVHAFMTGAIVVKATSVGDENSTSISKRYSLNQNFPNPFNSSTRISFYLPKKGKIKLEIYNILGQKMRTLAEREEEPGLKTLFWDGTDDRGLNAPTGIYFYRLTAQDFVDTKKMVYLK